MSSKSIGSLAMQRNRYTRAAGFCFVLALSPGYGVAQGIASDASAAAPVDKAQLVRLASDPKLLDSNAILEELRLGAATTSVIVTLTPTTAANALATQSQRAATMPAGAEKPGAPVFYDLSNESIRTQLRSTVESKVTQVITQLASPGLRVRQQFSYQFGFAADVTAAVLQQILASPEVVQVTKNRTQKMYSKQGIPLMRADIPPGTYPPGTYKGRGVSIAITDSGVDTAHPMLGNGGSPIFNAKVIGGYNTADKNADPRPQGNSHGTACAGIAAGDLTTSGDYIGGVAPEAKLYALKITPTNSDSAADADTIAAWEWVITNKNNDPKNPILIINHSFGGGEYASTCDALSNVTTAALRVVSAGITIFAASGNEGLCGSMGDPACISFVNSVGAVYDANIGPQVGWCVSANACSKYPYPGCSKTANFAADDPTTAADKVTAYSNSASFMTLFAPSNNAYTTTIVGTGGDPTKNYDMTFGGTSAASPYAAGAAAILQSAFKAKTGVFLTPAEVRNYLINNGDIITDTKIAVSKPRVNLAKAVSALPGDLLLPNRGGWRTLLGN